MPQAKKAPEVYLFHPPSPEPAETGSFPMAGYVEEADKPRTKLATFFNILPTEWLGRCVPIAPIPARIPARSMTSKCAGPVL